MNNLKNSFKDFFYFYKEIAYLIVLSHLVLIIIIIVLSLIIRQKNETTRFLRNGIIRRETTQYIDKLYKDGLLEAEYRILIKSTHR